MVTKAGDRQGKCGQDSPEWVKTGFWLRLSIRGSKLGGEPKEIKGVKCKNIPYYQLLAIPTKEVNKEKVEN